MPNLLTEATIKKNLEKAKDAFDVFLHGSSKHGDFDSYLVDHYEKSKDVGYWQGCLETLELYKGHTIRIIVEGGIVQDVANLPDGWLEEEPDFAHQVRVEYQGRLSVQYAWNEKTGLYQVQLSDFWHEGADSYECNNCSDWLTKKEVSRFRRAERESIKRGANITVYL